MIYNLENHDSWIIQRQKGIGGSDAGTLLGVNKYKSNVELWEEKTGVKTAADISNKPAVKYGKEAEKHIRELFALDYPEFQISYHEFWMYQSDIYNFIYATLDGEIIDQNGKKGVFECKTTTIQNQSQWEKWDDRIPETYYAQILHQLIATGWDFVILRAYIRYHKDGNIRATVRDYRIERSEVVSDIDWLIKKECEFWQCVTLRKKPPLILPEI